MPTDVAPGLCFQQSFELFEQFSQAAQGWEMDFRQLDTIDSPFRLEQMSTTHMLYSRAYFGCRFHQLGGPVVGFRTFALHTAGSSDYRWCGEAVNRHSLVVLPVGGQFESVSERGFDIFTLSLSNELLERTAQLQFQRPLSSFIGAQGEVCRRGGSSLQRLRTRLHALSDEIRGVGSFPLGAPATRPHPRNNPNLLPDSS